MRTSTIIIIIFIFFVFAFLQVFLQTEIIKLGYQVKRNEDKLQEVIDNNNILKYNIYALESPKNLDKYASIKNSNLKILKPVQVVSLKSQTKQKHSQDNKKTRNPIFLALMRFFSGKQAEAKTIK